MRVRGRQILAFYSSDDHDAHEVMTMADEDAPNLTDDGSPRRRRGFALVEPSRLRAIAAMGGRAAHAAGTAHRFTTDEARAAGRKGGIASHVSRGSRRADA